MTSPYKTGQITLTNGSAAIVGVGTAWAVSNIAGGVIYVEAQGNDLPIDTITDDTHAVAAVKWTGATGTYNYALLIEGAILPQTVANANKLASIIQALGSTSVGALASLANTMTAGKVPRANSANSMTWVDVSDFILNLLNDADGPAVYATLGTVPDARLPSPMSGKVFSSTCLFNSNGTTLSFQRNNANSIDIEAFQTTSSQAKHSIDLNRYGGGVTVAGSPVWHGGNGQLSAVQNGYQRLPSGLILQWGYRDTTGGDGVVNFPISFPNACLALAGSMTSAGLSGTVATIFGFSDLSKTGFVTRARLITGGAVNATPGQGATWMALGY